jgi:hypothetical protein
MGRLQQQQPQGPGLFGQFQANTNHGLLQAAAGTPATMTRLQQDTATAKLHPSSLLMSSWPSTTPASFQQQQFNQATAETTLNHHQAMVQSAMMQQQQKQQQQEGIVS